MITGCGRHRKSGKPVCHKSRAGIADTKTYLRVFTFGISNNSTGHLKHEGPYSVNFNCNILYVLSDILELRGFLQYFHVFPLQGIEQDPCLRLPTLKLSNGNLRLCIIAHPFLLTTLRERVDNCLIFSVYQRLSSGSSVNTTTAYQLKTSEVLTHRR